MNTQSKRLYRSRRERMFGGVCGGIGEYFDIDPTLVRVVFVATAIMGGPGLLAYLILLFVVPEEPLGAEASVVDVVDATSTDAGDETA